MTSTPPQGTAPRKRNWLVLLIGLIVGGAIAILLTVFVGMPLALGHRNDLPLEKLYADFAVNLAVKPQAGPATNPNGTSGRALQDGQAAYTGSCAVCHGVGGDGKGMFGDSIYPPASDLRAHDTQEKSDAELFWIIKNGLSFAGMPGFGSQYSDQDIWNLVSYTRALGSGTKQSRSLEAPTPTTQQLALADPKGEAANRGAAVYFAQGCHLCHGPVGDGVGILGLIGRTREAEEAVRRGRRGMPAYSPDQVSDAQLTDLVAYLQTFGRR